MLISLEKEINVFEKFLSLGYMIMGFYDKSIDEFLATAGDRPFVLLPCGLPGSGKSTYIKELKARLPALRILCRDDVVLKKASEYKISYRKAYNQLRKQIDDEYNRLLADALSAPCQLVIDRTHITPSIRAKVISEVLSGVSKYAVSFVVDKNDLKTRLSKRQVVTGIEIPFSVVEEMARSFENPNTKEGFEKVFDTQSTIRSAANGGLSQAVLAADFAENKAARQAINTGETPSMPKNHGAKWTADEQVKLAERYAQKADINEIALSHGRSAVSISMMLVRLGMIEENAIKTVSVTPKI